MPSWKVGLCCACNCFYDIRIAIQSMFSLVLKVLPDALNMRTRLRLMELNRAVCLECPEFQVPWFHQRYCHQLQKKGLKKKKNPLKNYWFYSEIISIIKHRIKLHFL